MNISAASSMSASLYGTDSTDQKIRPAKVGDDNGFKNDHRGRNPVGGSSFKNDIAGKTFVSTIGDTGSFKNDIAGKTFVSSLSGADSSADGTDGLDLFA